VQPRSLVANATAAIALLSAGCGSTTQSTPSTSPTPSAIPTVSPSLTPTEATIAVAKNSLWGRILVDGTGITVYAFTADTGTASTCYASCAESWPPVLTGGVTRAGTGATASLLGTTTRSDGKVQVTYARHPLYYFWKDRQPGDTNGQNLDGFGGSWHLVSSSGAWLG
jgi:predicted lipoprotein with Yx(FWY)xxD motif